MADLSTSVCGLTLANPTILAAGVLDETGKTMKAVASAGAGALVTKSIGKSPRQGHDNPCVVELDYGLLNAMGLPNPGIEAYREEIAIALESGAPVIGSVFGGDEEEISEVAALMEDCGVAAVELNLSCPHAKGLGAEIGSSPEKVESVCREAKNTVGIPVLAKLTPNTRSIVELAEAAERGGADALVAINTLKGMAISPEARMPVLANKLGGLSGPAIKPIGLRCVYEIYEAVEIPVVGVGGVSNGRDAVEYIMAGASAVQIGTAVWRQGLSVFRTICDEISEFMDENGIAALTEIVGAVHERRD